MDRLGKRQHRIKTFKLQDFYVLTPVRSGLKSNILTLQASNQMALGLLPKQYLNLTSWLIFT
jgi:hypothetical protein